MLNYKRPKLWIIILSIVTVTVVGFALASNPKATSVQGDSTDALSVGDNIQSEVTLAKTDGVTLYAASIKDDLYECIVVQTENARRSFSWIAVTNPTFAPTAHIADINDDGSDEIIIILTTGYGTGIFQQEIHILTRKDLLEIDIQDPLEEIDKVVSSTVVRQHETIEVSVKCDNNVVKKSYSASDSDLWFDKLAFGSSITYAVSNNKITAILNGAISPFEFPVSVYIEYGPNLKIHAVNLGTEYMAGCYLTEDKSATIDDTLAYLEQEDHSLLKQLETDLSLCQAELNAIAEDRYLVWDSGLNLLRDKLRDALDAPAMENLTMAEQTWLSYKNEEMEKAGAEVEGGSLQTIFVYGKGRELTRARVYELAEYLR